MSATARGSAAIVERLLDGEPLTADERRHLAAVPSARARRRARPVLDAGIARAAGRARRRRPASLSGSSIPPIVEPPSRAGAAPLAGAWPPSRAATLPW